MKTRIIKLFMLPIAAFALASAAAVTTDTSRESKAKAAPMTAYIHNPNITSCLEVKVDCESGIGLECVSGAWEAFGGSQVVCAEKLQRVE